MFGASCYIFFFFFSSIHSYFFFIVNVLELPKQWKIMENNGKIKIIKSKKKMKMEKNCLKINNNANYIGDVINFYFKAKKWS